MSAIVSLVAAQTDEPILYIYEPSNESPSGMCAGTIPHLAPPVKAMVMSGVQMNPRSGYGSAFTLVRTEGVWVIRERGDWIS